MTSTLPQELLDQTIDHLWNDIPSLTACTLAGRACLAAARTHLFYEQRILGAKGFSRLEAFLEDCSAVAPYIRKLSVTEPSCTTRDQGWFDRVLALVPHLTRLGTFELIGLQYISLRRCDAAALAAFARLEHLVLADVYFDRFADVHTLLAAAHNARSICFYRVGWAAAPSLPSTPAHEAPVTPLPTPLRLQRLVVDSWAASAMLREWLLPCAALGEVGIRSLMIRWRERDAVDVLNALFRACGAALEHLFVELPTTANGAQEAPSLHHNARLRSLEIDGLVLPGCVGWASSLLAQLRSAQLEKLSISLLVLRADVLASFEWGQLDAVLAQPAFAGVALAITVNRALHPDNDAEGIRAAVIGQLPRAEARGRLAVRCS